MKEIAEKSTNRQIVVSVQSTGKWIERFSQSERALHKGYVIKNNAHSVAHGHRRHTARAT